MNSYIINIRNEDFDEESERMMIISESMNEVKEFGIKAIVSSYYPDKRFSTKLYRICVEPETMNEYLYDFMLAVRPRSEDDMSTILLIQIDQYYNRLEWYDIYE